MRSQIKLLLVCSLMGAAVLSACTPPARMPTTSPPAATSSPVPTLNLPQVATAESLPKTPVATGQVIDETHPAVVAARKLLADSLKVDLSLVKVVSVEQVEWPDSCLGSASRDEVCLMVITPGYRVILQEGSRTYFVHTNLAGTSVRLARK